MFLGNGPSSLNGSVLMLAQGKYRPVLVITKIDSIVDYQYPTNIVVVPILSFKKDKQVDLSKKDVIVIPSFPGSDCYSYICLSEPQTIYKSYCLKSEKIIQLSDKVMNYIIKQYVALIEG